MRNKGCYTRLHILFTLLTAMALLPAPVAAQDILAPERLVIPVRPIDATSFEVLETVGVGGPQIWCAARLFSKDYLGQRGGDIAVGQSFP